MTGSKAAERQEIMKAVMQLAVPVQELASMMQDVETPLDRKAVRSCTARIGTLARRLNEACENVLNS
jgi:cytochrome c556